MHTSSTSTEQTRASFLAPHWSKVHFGEFFYNPGANLGPRRQSRLQLVYVFSGSIRLTQNDKTFEIGPGQGLLLLWDSIEFFEFSKDDVTHHGWCEFLPEQECVIAKSKQFGLSGKVIDLSDTMLRLHEQGLHCLRRKDVTTAAYLCAAMISEYCRLIEEPEFMDHLPNSVKRAKIFIEGNVHRQLNMEEVAKCAHISLPHLNRLFKQLLKMTPSAYMCKKKAQTAEYLLSESGLELEEIAQRVGFSNLSHFCQFFKRHVGVSPLQFRKHKWNLS